MKWSCPWLGLCCDLCRVPQKSPKSTYKEASRTCNHHATCVRERRGARTDRQNSSAAAAVSVEINDCGDEKAGRLANGVGSWPAGQDRGSAVRDEARTSPLDTPSSLEHPATAQLRLVRVGGARERADHS